MCIASPCYGFGFGFFFIFQLKTIKVLWHQLSGWFDGKAAESFSFLSLVSAFSQGGELSIWPALVAIVELIKTYWTSSFVVSWGINWSDRKLLITFPTHQTSSSPLRLFACAICFSFKKALTKQKTIWATNGRVVKISNWLIRCAVFTSSSSSPSQPSQSAQSHFSFVFNLLLNSNTK